MSLYETIEMTFLQLVKSGQVPARLHLTEEGLTALINDRTLGASWTPSIPEFWDQRVLGLPLAKAAIHNAWEVDRHRTVVKSSIGVDLRHSDEIKVA